jgi:hypothetical protein
MKLGRILLAGVASCFLLICLMGGECTVVADDEPDVDIFRMIAD